MNRKVRKRLVIIIDQIEQLKFELETIKDDEEEKLDNMPESLKGDRFLESIENLENALDGLEGVIGSISEASN